METKSTEGKIIFSGNLLPKNGFFHVDASPTHGCLSAVRSEKILASQMHPPAILNLQSPNKFVRIQIGGVQMHFKIKIATPGESGHAASLRGVA